MRPARDYRRDDGSKRNQDNGAKEVVTDQVSSIAGALVRLIGESVAEVEVSGTRTLLLTFSGGHVLRLIDDSRQFESFQVQQSDQLIVV